MTVGSDVPGAAADEGDSKRRSSSRTSSQSGTKPNNDSTPPIDTQEQQTAPSSADDSDDEATFHDAEDAVEETSPNRVRKSVRLEDAPDIQTDSQKSIDSGQHGEDTTAPPPYAAEDPAKRTQPDNGGNSTSISKGEDPAGLGEAESTEERKPTEAEPDTPQSRKTPKRESFTTSPIVRKDKRKSGPAVSEWSHQRLARAEESDDEEEEVAWQAMPALGEFDIYDDDGRIVAKAQKEEEAEMAYRHGSIGGAGKGYTRIQLDEDAQSATSMDEDTSYLFKQDPKAKQLGDDFEDDDEEQRDAAAQLENTKDLLTEGQRIAYVGVVRLTIHKMLKALADMERTKAIRKEVNKAQESMELWGQKMMVRLYSHMDIESAEQLMIEQLAEHGVQPSDLAPPLMQNARVKNPMADEKSEQNGRPSLAEDRKPSVSLNSSKEAEVSLSEVKNGEEVPEVHGPEEMPKTENLELDIRWTVLCDLFLVLISDSSYDARSRRLLERVASTMDITWLQICRFEKRVIDALEMQEEELQEDHDESENMEKRRKLMLRKKYMYMGLATVGGGLVIGLSAGLLAPMIGAGLAAGFTTIGVSGTAGFLGGVGGAALITSIGITTGGTIAVRASNRRTGHVKTFEYRPLHNNKRLNLILTVSGWMNGKVDDVRLPYSTVDPIMGDIYSLYWEPEMLQSMGETIQVLATEALTQTIQQVLGSTILVTLMAGLQLPIILTKLSYLIDNPWSVSLDRANAAGLILADSLMQKHLGDRPITLVGFSLGARVIFSCLKELSARSVYGLVQNVYVFGSPIVASRDEYLRARSVISGRFVNGYAANDWILGYLFRMTSGGLARVAGLAAVEDVPGLENKDVGEYVNGHMSYRAAMPKLLREVGWEVESDEFTEIEDPDPDNHEKRQRELIQEIDDARKKAEEKPEKKRFGLFKRGKLAEKRAWESYAPDKNGHNRNPSDPDAANGGSEPNVLFDIDAIRRELASEMIEVRELDSSMPPMQITSIKDGEKHIEYLRLPPEVDLSKGKFLNPPVVLAALRRCNLPSSMAKQLLANADLACHSSSLCRLCFFANLGIR